ncbi:hypothetical protein DFH28DRAFT_920015 [Melampsora americana]|nr:hypothetical protein DFH28DRAFT_920015 [Melampsora americana]
MTATMQVGHEDYLFRLFCITNVKIFREPTGRPELQFQTVRNCKWEVMMTRVGRIVTDATLVEQDRNILFIENKKECNDAEVDLKKLHPNVPITKYYSGLPEAEAHSNVNFWRTTPRCLMIATSGFGAGINYKHVRNVLIFGLPEDDTEINKCFQQAGRAGRDLKAATVWLFEMGKPEKGSLGEKLMDMNKCITGTFSVPLDGERIDCKDVGCPRVCLHCVQNGRHSEKRPAGEALQDPLPGTRPMYLANVKRSNVQTDIVDTLALEITRVRSLVAGLCGYCLAQKIETKHLDKSGRCDKIGCLRCTGQFHGWPKCPALPMSKILEKNSNAAFRLCFFCGLGDRQGKDQFHSRQGDKNSRTCDSGLQNTLSCGDIHVQVRCATVDQFQAWLGGRGWLGCPWANMITLFVVLNSTDMMRKVTESHVV